MGIEREELKSCMFAIDNEYNNFLPKEIDQQSLKIDTWFAALKNYSYKQVQQATMQVLCTFTYGTPKLAHVVEILDPPMQNQNEGIEFATRLIDLSAKYGTEKIGDKVVAEFGQVGYSVYRQVKNELRELKTDDSNTFKAQLRTLYNSYKERESHNTLDNLPYRNEAQKAIEQQTKIMVSKMLLEKNN